MKRFLTKLIPGLLLLGLMQGVAHAQVKIATVDLSRVFTNYWKFKTADTALQDMKAELSKSDKELLDSRQKAIDGYKTLLADANNQVLSSEERDKKKKAAEDKLKEIKDLEQSIDQFERNAKTRLAEQSARMRENLLTEIRAAVTSKGKAGSYTFIFDSAAQTSDRTPVLLYSSGEDITDSVLSQLNAGAPVEVDQKKAPAKP
ncbi:MAG TPA: OmpH family outer membrane protein [Verrucomicrobiae bacterium]|nr:OmpH family outer membrane protein [Verrucomicrobiae bacterium]